MPCKLSRPSAQELFDTVKDKFSANVLDGASIVPESLEWYVVSNDYAAAEMFHTIAEQQFKARDAREACCEDLYEMAARRGVYPRSAGFSQGYVRVTGIPCAPVPDPLEIAFGSHRFIAIGCDTDVIPESGYIIVRVQAVTPGPEANNAPADTVGTVLNAPTGIDTTATAYGSEFCGGTEEETCEEFRQRYLRRLSFKPKATHSWLMETIAEWPCVTRVVHRDGSCCVVSEGQTTDCGCSQCTNKLEFYPLFENTFDCGIPPACVIEEMNIWLFGDPPGRGLGQAEIGVCGKLYQAQPALVNVRLGGLTCASQNQLGLVKSRITDIMRMAEPSQVLKLRSLETAISQVMGDFNDYTVSFEILSGDVTIDSCGDLNPACDVLPCLNEIIVANAYQPAGC